MLSYLWRGSESNTWRCCTTAALQWSWGALPPPAGCPRAVQSAGLETWGSGWRCCGWCSWPAPLSPSADSCGGERGKRVQSLKRKTWQETLTFSVRLKLYTEACDTTTSPNEIKSFIGFKNWCWLPCNRGIEFSIYVLCTAYFTSTCLFRAWRTHFHSSGTFSKSLNYIFAVSIHKHLIEYLYPHVDWEFTVTETKKKIPEFDELDPDHFALLLLKIPCCQLKLIQMIDQLFIFAPVLWKIKLY